MRVRNITKPSIKSTIFIQVVFCKYPFVYTAEAKAKLLKIDANQQMMQIVQKIAVNQFLSRGQINVNPFLEVIYTSLST